MKAAGKASRFTPSLRVTTQTRMLGNLFGAKGASASASGEVVSKVYFDVEIGGKAAGMLTFEIRRGPNLDFLGGIEGAPFLLFLLD